MKDTTFKSVEEAIEFLGLDRRHKWFEFSGEIVRNGKVSLGCSGCDGNGCRECGGKGKRVQNFPIPVIVNGSPVKIKL